jgi:hypothetical protein
MSRVWQHALLWIHNFRQATQQSSLRLPISNSS